MGLNAFFTYTLIINGGVPWPVALGIIFWAGVLFLLVSATPLRERIAMAIPAITALGDGGGHRAAADVHRPAERRASSPPTRRRWSASGRSIIARCSRSRALIVSVWLSRRNNPFAYLAGIVARHGGRVGGRLGDAAGAVVQRAGLLQSCSSSSTSGARCKLSLVPAMITVMMTDLFDSLSTFIGVAQAAQSRRRATASRRTFARA